ncbi:alpha/beta fold hydrolase [Streptomyces sp. NPDC057555]|uniref:alpha/beta fold hydrolase n=1 Tax=Streptomyces sp. NPDC057555 TaxID=3346166 RepID=UPI0036911681
MGIRRPSWGRITLVGLGMLALLTPSNAWAQDEQVGAGRLSAWHPCKDDPGKPGVECAELTVPVDWARPDGQQVRLDVKRQKAADPAQRLGTLMTAPGGPGQRGTVVVTDGYLPDSIRNSFDAIGYDSRGTGDTKAQCAPAPKAAPLPRNEAEFNTLLETNKRYGESCRTTPASLIDHLDAVSDARDMEALRDALGEEKLNYYGASYGTLRGQTYASLFPRRTGRMVLDGNMDHSVKDARTFMGTETLAAEKNLNDFFDWCDTNTGCSLHAQGAKKTFSEVYAKAEQADKASPGHVYDLVNEATIGASNGRISKDSWRELADEIGKRGNSATLPSADLTMDGPNQAIFCSDWNLPVKNYTAWKTMLSDIARESPNLKISEHALVPSGVLGCLGWPRQAAHPQQDLPKWNTNPRALMVESLHDAQTPYAWSQAAARQSGAVLLTYDGGGHIVAWSGKMSDQVEKYLLTGRRPADGTHCDDTDCYTRLSRGW